MSGDLAEDLWRARNSGGTLPPSAGDSLTTVAEAYAVQRRIAALAAMRRFGWKVGATSEVAQRLLDTPGPATAPLLEPLCFESSTTFMVFPGQDTSVECEFAFRFAHALPPRDAEYGRDEVLDAVDLLMPAIEIVACRSIDDFFETSKEAVVRNILIVKRRQSENFRHAMFDRMSSQGNGVSQRTTPSAYHQVVGRNPFS